MLVAVLMCLLGVVAARLATPAAARTPDCASATPGTATPESAGAKILSPDWTSRAFFVALLTRLKLPATDENLDALYAIEHFEGDNDRFNPLNVVQPEPGSSSINGVGVQAYTSFETGLDGAATLLANSHWTGVRSALAVGTSTSQVLGAFQSAYTWVSAAFPVSDAISRAEAIRDVGGPYSDQSMAEQRAAAYLAPLNAHFAFAACAIGGARARSAAAHAAWNGRAGDYAAQRAIYADNLARGTADQAAVRAARAPVTAAILADYRTGPDHMTVQALLAQDPNRVLSRGDLMHYISRHNLTLFRQYNAQAAAAKNELAAAARAQAVMTTIRSAMVADQTAWTAADRAVVSFRAAARLYLGGQLASSLTHAQAVSDLRALDSL